MLTKVKLALRVSGSAFDDEIKLLIDACIDELRGLGVFHGPSSKADDDPQISQTIVCYCKWQFGQNDKAETWEAIYNDHLSKLQCRTGYGLGDD